MFYVYVLHSIPEGGLYIGYSTDLKKRISEHRRGACFATRHRGPGKLIYYEAYIEREDAKQRERYLKNGSGRRFLRTQLRYYLKRYPTRLAECPESFRGLRGLPRLDSNQE